MQNERRHLGAKQCFKPRICTTWSWTRLVQHQSQEPGKVSQGLQGFRTGQRKPRIGTVNISQYLTVLTYLSTVPEKPFPCFFTRCSQSNGKTRKKKARYFCQPGPMHRFIEAGRSWPSEISEPTHQTAPYGAPPVRVFDLQPGCWICQRHGRIRILPRLTFWGADRSSTNRPWHVVVPYFILFRHFLMAFWKWSKLKQPHAFRKYTIASTIHVYASS